MLTSENAGISNNCEGENPSRRKSKVSWAMMINPGLAEPKGVPEGVRSKGNTVDIPWPQYCSNGVTEHGRMSVIRLLASLYC